MKGKMKTTTITISSRYGLLQDKKIRAVVTSNGDIYLTQSQSRKLNGSSGDYYEAPTGTTFIWWTRE